MYEEFKNISEAALWDNLKRKANRTLRMLDREKNVYKKLEAFDTKYPEQIQKLLENIGKELFKIFLFKAIEQDLQVVKEKEGKENQSIFNTIKNFKFYYWPGYTTLKNKRIFIIGSKRNETSNRRFFTGLGNRSLIVKESSLLSDFFKRIDFKEDRLFDLQGKSLWVKDIPSVIAYDSILNQYYINKEEIQYQVGSTHYWKSSQTLNSNDEFEYISMPFSSDGSELQILEIGVGDYSISATNNKMFISLTADQLQNSGPLIAKALSRGEIPINFKQNDRKDYKQWPRRDPEEIQINIDLQDLYKLQTASYSYWLSESLNIPDKYRVYNHIKEMFEKAGLDVLAERLKPFRESKGNNGFRENLEEIYYNYWTTVFLESYGPSVDLGTVMFFSSHQYSSEFLIKTANWIRRVYNELRLVEARASEEIHQEQEDFGRLAHNTKLFFPFVIDRIQKTTCDDLDQSKKLIVSELLDLENIIKGTFYSNDFNLFKEHYISEKISLVEEIEKILEIIIFDIRSNRGEIIKLPPDLDFQDCILTSLNSQSDPLFNKDFKSKGFVNGYSGILKIILKDLIGNATKWSTSPTTPGKPKPVVTLQVYQEEGKYVVFKITNTHYISKDAIYVWENGAVPEDSTLNMGFGLKIASHYCKMFGIKKLVETSEDTGTTTFILKFKEWENSKS